LVVVVDGAVDLIATLVVVDDGCDKGGAHVHGAVFDNEQVKVDDHGDVDVAIGPTAPRCDPSTPRIP
jgi:hypothetical protein